jgi:hypothetical protein
MILFLQDMGSDSDNSEPGNRVETLRCLGQDNSK